MTTKRDPTSTDQSRRTILKGAAAATLLAGTGNLAAAQDDDDDDNDNDNDNDEGIFVLGGHQDYWFGIAPEDIEGEENPTLELDDGEDYEIVWINMDGEPHNIAIQDEDEEDLEEVDDEVDEIGETQSIEFTASGDMDTYYCTIHPEDQIGDLEVDNNDNDDDNDNDDNDD